MTQLHTSSGLGPATGSPGGRSRQSWRWLAWSAAAGVAVGLLWWTLAPTGLVTRDPASATGVDTAAWLPRDLTLAGLFLFAGCLSGLLLTGRIMQFSYLKFGFALAGGLVGAVIAWQVGMVAAAWWGEPVDATANASIAFSLRSLPVLLVWPAATAAATFIAILLSLADRDSSGAGKSPR